MDKVARTALAVQRSRAAFLRLRKTSEPGLRGLVPDENGLVPLEEVWKLLQRLGSFKAGHAPGIVKGCSNLKKISDLITVKNTFIELRIAEENEDADQGPWTYLPLPQHCSRSPVLDARVGPLETSLWTWQSYRARALPDLQSLRSCPESEESEAEAKPEMSTSPMGEVCTIQGCEPCVYFVSHGGCHAACALCHVHRALKKGRPRKFLRKSYKDMVERALEFQEPERQRELQQLAAQDNYLRALILAKLKDVWIAESWPVDVTSTST
eukprot:s4875_g2.t1